MDKAKREELVDKLLVGMNDELVENGCTLNELHFNFTEEQEDYCKYKNHLNLSSDELYVVLNACLSDEYITMKSIRFASQKFDDICLTEIGKARAKSVEQAELRPICDSKSSVSTIHIETIHANGSTQIGNNNIQNIDKVFNDIHNEIDNYIATPEEKAEAKGVLAKAIQNPIIAGIISAATGTAVGEIVKNLLK